MHPKIEDCYLYPRKVYVACNNHACRNNATSWLVADGLGVYRACEEHSPVATLQKIDPEANWHLAPIYHDDPAMPEQVKPRPPELC
jgi:hypothetical protein